jgi:hypothetical protein
MKRHIRINYKITARAEVIADVPDYVPDSEVFAFLEENGKFDDARRVVVNSASEPAYSMDSVELTDDDDDHIIYYGER